MVRNISNNDLIKSERSMKKETRKQTLYSIDDDYIQYHLDLNKYTNTACTHFHDEFVTKYNIPVAKTSFHNFISHNCVPTSRPVEEQVTANIRAIKANSLPFKNENSPQQS